MSPTGPSHDHRGQPPATPTSLSGAHHPHPVPLGEGSPHGVRVGLCGWTIAMSTYVRRFPLVEVQHTFYDPPADRLLARWRAQAPGRFEFTMKAWQLVTHESGSPTYRRLRRPLPEDHRGEVGAFR